MFLEGFVGAWFMYFFYFSRYLNKPILQTTSTDWLCFVVFKWLCLLVAELNNISPLILWFASDYSIYFRAKTKTNANDYFFSLFFSNHFTKIHRSVLREITIDLLYFWDVYDVNLWEKKFGRSTGYSCRTNIFI